MSTQEQNNLAAKLAAALATAPRVTVYRTTKRQYAHPEDYLGAHVDDDGTEWHYYLDRKTP